MSLEQERISALEAWAKSRVIFRCSECTFFAVELAESELHALACGHEMQEDT